MDCCLIHQRNSHNLITQPAQIETPFCLRRCWSGKRMGSLLGGMAEPWFLLSLERWLGEAYLGERKWAPGIVAFNTGLARYSVVGSAFLWESRDKTWYH